MKNYERENVRARSTADQPSHFSHVQNSHGNLLNEHFVSYKSLLCVSELRCIKRTYNHIIVYTILYYIPVGVGCLASAHFRVRRTRKLRKCLSQNENAFFPLSLVLFYTLNPLIETTDKLSQIFFVLKVLIFYVSLDGNCLNTALECYEIIINRLTFRLENFPFLFSNLISFHISLFLKTAMQNICTQ